RFIEVGLVEGRPDLAGNAVVQVSTRAQVDVVVLHRLVVVLQDRGVRPRLVGGVGRLAYAATDEGRDDAVFRRCSDDLPLFQLDDDGGLAAAGRWTLTGKHEVDALG